MAVVECSGRAMHVHLATIVAATQRHGLAWAGLRVHPTIFVLLVMLNHLRLVDRSWLLSECFGMLWRQTPQAGCLCLRKGFEVSMD